MVLLFILIDRKSIRKIAIFLISRRESAVIFECIQPEIYSPAGCHTFDSPETLAVNRIGIQLKILKDIPGTFVAKILQDQCGGIITAPLAPERFLIEETVRILPDMHQLVSDRFDEVYFRHAVEDVNIEFSAGYNAEQTLALIFDKPGMITSGITGNSGKGTFIDEIQADPLIFDFDTLSPQISHDFPEKALGGIPVVDGLPKTITADDASIGIGFPSPGSPFRDQAAAVFTLGIFILVMPAVGISPEVADIVAGNRLSADGTFERDMIIIAALMIFFPVRFHIGIGNGPATIGASGPVVSVIAVFADIFAILKVIFRGPDWYSASPAFEVVGMIELTGDLNIAPLRDRLLAVLAGHPGLNRNREGQEYQKYYKKRNKVSFQAQVGPSCEDLDHSLINGLSDTEI